MKGEIFMKKKLLSAILAGTLVLPTVVLPTSVGAEEANDSGTITVTYSPENYLIYYGTKYSGYYKYEYESMAITKNYIPKRQDNGAYAWPRTDQDKIYSQYKIMAPEAIVDVDINIQNMKLAMYKDVINNTITETGEVQTTESVREAVANFSLYYSTSMNDLPEGQEYGWYYTTQKDASTKTYVGGEAADVDALLSTWKSNLSSKTANPVLIETIVPSTFGVQTDKGIVRTETQTDGVTQSSKKNNAYETTNVSYDITDTVKQALVDGKNENGEVLFDVIYGAQKNGKNDYYVSDITKWYGDTTLTVTYDKDLIAADVNSAETFDELVAKVKFYASLLGVDVTKFNDAVLAEKLPQYVGTTFTGESFEALLENLKPVDITEYQVNISDLFNMSSWAYVGETVTDKSKMIAEGTHGSQRMSDSSKTSHTITDGDDTVTFNFDKERYHANVNNVFRGNVEDVFSIRNHARYAKNVYIVSTNFINHAGMYPITVKYTDGTSETKILETANKDQKSNGVMYNLLDSYVDYFWLGTRYGGITLETDETTGITTIGSTGAGDWGMLAWKFPVDSTKVIEEIIIENPKNVALELYAVAESVISNEEMRAYIANIEKLEAVTAENAAEVLVARKYADELKLRNVAVEADFEKLNELVEEVEWLAGRTDSKDIMYDLSSYFNRDYLAPKGSIMANGPVTYCGMHSEGYLKSNKNGYAEHTYNNGVQEVVEYNHKEVIGEDGTGTGKYTFEKTGETVKFKITPEMVSAGVNDTIEAIQGDTNIVIKANGNRVEKVYFLGDCPQMSTIGFIVNYKDGTSEKFSVKIAGWDWGIGSSANLAKKDSPYISGGLWFGYERYSIVTDDSGKLVMSSIPSRYTSVAMYGIELDATKQVESYELVPANGGDTYRAGIYALTEKTMSNDDMLAVIAEAEALLEEDAIGYVSTEENAKLVKTAAAYARELDERHAVKLEDNQLVLDLEEQAIAQEIKYLDLSAQADMDIIVKSGDTEKYASRDDSLLVDFDEYITAEERTDAEKAGWLPDPEAGTVYKLFGGWNGKGNDAVRVAPADEGGEGVVIDLNNEM